MNLVAINNACFSLLRKTRAAGNVRLFVEAPINEIKTMLFNLLVVVLCVGSASSYANNPPQGRLVASFSYNADGLRIEKQGERGIERYTYDDQSVLSQRDGNNALVARYTYGPNRLISLKHKTEGTQFYLTDALNSIVDLMTTEAIAQSTSFAMSFLTAKPNANVGAAAQKATQIVGNAAQGTGNVARTVATNFVKAVNEPRLGPLARQVGAVGSDIKPNENVRSSLGRIVPETASTATSSYSQLRASALFLKNEAGVVDASYRRQVIESFGADLRVGEYAGQAYQYSSFYGTASRYLTPAPLTNPIQSLALPPANSATLLQQYNIAATRALIGTAAPQNFGAPLTGGAQQIFIPSRSVLNSTLNLPRN